MKTTIMARWANVKSQAVKAWDNMEICAQEAAQIIMDRTGQMVPYWRVPFCWKYRSLEKGDGVEYYLEAAEGHIFMVSTRSGRYADGWFKHKDNDLSGFASSPHSLKSCEAAVDKALNLTTGDFIAAWERNETDPNGHGCPSVC